MKQFRNLLMKTFKDALEYIIHSGEYWLKGMIDATKSSSLKGVLLDGTFLDVKFKGNKLETVMLGAPTSIEGGASPNAELTVQIASSIKELTLHDDGEIKCTKDGANITTAKILRQKMEEESTWEGMTAVYGDTLADVIANGGNLQLSVHDADGNPVKAYWEIAEIIEAEQGATATINQDGVLTLTEGKKIQGKVRAMNWNNSMEQVVFYFAVESSELGSVIRQHPEYMELLVEYPALINSLADTGKRNVITQITSSDAGLINTGIVCSADMSFRAIVKPSIKGSTNYVFGGGGSTAANCMYQYFNLNGTNVRTYMRYAATEVNKTDAKAQDQWGEYKFDIDSYSVLGVETSRTSPANVSSFVEKETAPICIFGAMRDDNGTSFTRNTSAGDSLSIEVLEIRKGTEQHKFVPYIKNGENGMLDLFDLSFHANAHTTGSFDIVTENKE